MPAMSALCRLLAELGADQVHNDYGELALQRFKCLDACLPECFHSFRVRRRSDKPNITFDRLDHIVHLSIPYLLGKAKGESLGRVQRNMRR